MKFLFLFLLSLSLSLEVSAQDAVHSYKYVWGDFRGFNETAQTKGFTMGDAKLDSNGHILLDKNTVSFSFDRTAVRPSLADNKPFCIGLTFEANSFLSPYPATRCSIYSQGNSTQTKMVAPLWT